MKILLVDDHALFREGLCYVLAQLEERVEILESGHFSDALNLAKQHPDIDLALLDLNMPGSEGVISIKYFHRSYPQIPVVVVSGDDSQMEKVMNCGAMGYISKSSSASVMLGALNLVLSGSVYIPPQLLRQQGDMDDFDISDRRSLYTNEHGLTRRQMQVLKHLSEGLSNREIADAVNLAEGTVKIHVAAIYQNLRVNNRMEAVRAAEKLGLVSKFHG